MPKPLSAVDCVSPALDQTKRQLFAPFRLKRWWRLALVCLLTGEFVGGGGGGFPTNFTIPHIPTPPRNGKELFAFPNAEWEQLLPWVPWIVAGVVLLFLLVFLFIYVAAVYRFVLFDSVLYDRCELKGSWSRWEPSGRSYFYWSLGLFAVSMLGVGLIMGGAALIAWRGGLFHNPSDHVLALILDGGAAFLLLLLCSLVVGITGVLAKDFCVPIMAMENVGVLDAWRRLLPILSAQKLSFTGYVLMKIVLVIAAAIIVGMVSMVIFIVLLIPLVIAGLIIFFGGKAMGLTFNLATISILVILGGAVLTAFLYLLALINTPAMVFFQSYMIHFMGSRYPTLGAIVFPPPPEPPPLPLAPPPALPSPPLPEPSIG